MWSSTASDNKKKEEVEDCKCSSDNSGAADTNIAAGTAGGAQKLHTASTHQQPLNVFESSSKQTTAAKTFGGNFDKLEKETSDSGFISGPQSEAIEDKQDNADYAQGVATGGGGGGSTTAPTHKFNIIAAAAQPVVAQHSKEEEKLILDSGCIDEDFNDEEEAEEVRNDDAHDNNKLVEQHKAALAIPTTTATAAGEQRQVQNELYNKTVEAAATINATADPQMLLQQNVDSGMSEWFCKLNLQNEPTTSQQQQQQQVAGSNMNNLSAGTGRKLANSLNQSSNKQQHAAGNYTTTTNTTTTTANTTANANAANTSITPSNAWEQFYQQNDDGDTPMHLACITGYADIVAALIRMAPHPCLFNIQNDEAQTPLHLAALAAQPKILRMLLIAGAEPTIRDRHGNTALHLACTAGEEQCVRALTIPISASEINEAHRQYGHRSNDKTVSYLSCARLPSDLEIRNYDGERCVHLAAHAGHIEILRILVVYGADINAREGKSGCTPLHIAIKCCNEDLANFLLDECQKLNLETATYAGLTAYQVACILNKSQMQNILEKRGAEPLTPPDSDYDSDIETDLEDTKGYDRFGDPGYFANYNGGNPMTVA